MAKMYDILKASGLTVADTKMVLEILKASPEYSGKIKESKVFEPTVDGSATAIGNYIKYILNQKAKEKVEEYQKELAVYQKASSILVTSGFQLEGYRITRYSGYISGDDATKITKGEVFGDNYKESISNALVKIRRQALLELKRAAYDLDCNAVIGVDFDYMTFESEAITGPNTVAIGHEKIPYTICVTANGNAVVIEKE